MDTGVLQTMLRQEPRRLTRTAYAVVRDWEASEDVAQETLERAVSAKTAESWHAAPDDEVAICGWLSRTTRNLALNAIRDRDRRPVVSDPGFEPERAGEDGSRRCVTCGQWTDAARDPLTLSLERENDDVLRDALAVLTPEQLDVLWLRHGESLSTRETAGRLGISEDLVKWRLSTARRRVRDALATEPAEA